MARYIKEDLVHQRHLILADYTGAAPMSRYNDSPDLPCSSEYFDNSWQSPYVDVIGYNDYNSSADRFLCMAETSYRNMYCWYANYDYTGEINYVQVPGFFDIPKPVVHPESGFLDAFSCDHTGFIKEIMAVPFTGNASTGMSWDEWSSTEHWHWMSKSKSFLENELLNSLDLGSETWIPSRVLSDDERAEVFYLRKIDDNHKKLVGVIMNRTWNWFTMGFGGFCDQIPYDYEGQVNDALLPNVLHNLIPIGDSNSHIKIPQMEVAKRYHIQYIDADDLSILNEETVNTVDSKLRLESYPLLSVFRPFVYFEAWRDPVGDDDDESFLPITNEMMERKDSMNSLGVSSSTEELTRIELRVYPVPCISEFFIDSSIQDNFVLLDVNGNTVLEIFNLSGERMVDVSDISAGAYTLLSLRTGVRKKVIILS